MDNLTFPGRPKVEICPSGNNKIPVELTFLKQNDAVFLIFISPTLNNDIDVGGFSQEILNETFSNENELAQKRRLKKFYFLSVVCLLPVLGPLFGIVLLVYAIFIFKNIKLTAVILFGMAGGFGLTKLYGAYMRHQILYSKDSENAYS